MGGCSCYMYHTTVINMVQVFFRIHRSCDRAVNQEKSEWRNKMKEYMNTNLSPARRAELLLAELGPEEKLSQLICFMPIQKGACAELRQKYPQEIGRAHV